jgi:hypothetical protein
MHKPTDDEKAAIRGACTKFLSFETPRSAADWVAALAASPSIGLDLDMYSAGPAITRLEERVAGLLGKPAALWFPKGIIAQQAALLVHAQAAGRRTVALHPKSHLAIDEAGALERLAGLTMLRVGKDLGLGQGARRAVPSRCRAALGGAALDGPQLCRDRRADRQPLRLAL